MENERRRLARISISSEYPQGQFCLYINGEAVGFHALRDVSPFGMSLLLALELTKDSEVTLQYSYEEVELAVSGTVVWCVADGACGHFRAGVLLKEDAVSDNAAFFTAVTTA